MKKYAVIYLHVSDESESIGQDLYSQAVKCQEYAYAHEFTICNSVFIDDSRKVNDQIKKWGFLSPFGREYVELTKAYEYIRLVLPEPSYLIIYSTDLLPKNKGIRNIFYADLKNRGIKLISITEGEIQLKVNIFLQILRIMVNTGYGFLAATRRWELKNRYPSSEEELP